MIGYWKLTSSHETYPFIVINQIMFDFFFWNFVFNYLLSFICLGHWIAAKLQHRFEGLVEQINLSTNLFKSLVIILSTILWNPISYGNVHKSTPSCQAIEEQTHTLTRLHIDPFTHAYIHTSVRTYTDTHTLMRAIGRNILNVFL